MYWFDVCNDYSLEPLNEAPSLEGMAVCAHEQGTVYCDIYGEPVYLRADYRSNTEYLEWTYPDEYYEN
jgi:hypothetical protein